MPLGQAELVDRDRNGVGFTDTRRLFDRADLHLAMLSRVQGLDRVVEQRQILVRRGSRHCRSLSWGPGLRFASRKSGRKAFWRRPLLSLQPLGKRAEAQ